MPITIPTHQAAALPLKLWRPRWFDGAALVTRAAKPDAGYVLAGIAEPPGHAWHAPLWFNLPVAVGLALTLRRAAPYVAAHLPAADPLSLRDYGVLDRVRHPLAVTAALYQAAVLAPEEVARPTGRRILDELCTHAPPTTRSAARPLAQRITVGEA